MNRTSVVGVFAKGETPDGVVDLYGNIWEWSASNLQTKKIMKDFKYKKNVSNTWEEIKKASGQKKKHLTNGYVKLLKKGVLQLPELRGGAWNERLPDLVGITPLWDSPAGRDRFAGFRAARIKS